MSEQPTPKGVEPRDELEILPADTFDERSAIGGSRISVSFDARGGNRRVYIAKPGPIGTILLVVGLGMLLVVSFVVMLGVFAVLLCLSSVFMSGLLLYGLFERYLRRPR